MNAKDEISMLVKSAMEKRSNNIAYENYLKMNDQQRRAAYERLRKTYGGKQNIRGVDAKSRLHYGFMDLYELEMEKAKKAKAYRDASVKAENESRAAAQRSALRSVTGSPSPRRVVAPKPRTVVPSTPRTVAAPNVRQVVSPKQNDDWSKMMQDYSNRTKTVVYHDGKPVHVPGEVND